VLKHYEIISAIVQFFNQRDEPITELENSIWRRDFGFLVDITEKLIELNLQLRGRYKELAEMISDIKAFVNKPEFWEQNLIDGDTRHFPVLSAKISQSPLEPYDKKTSLYPNVIMRGTKLILMEVGNVKFLDSLNYFPMPLTALPKAFDLKELKKGYFPHYSTLWLIRIIGPIPALDFYDPDHLKEDAREKLLKWHGERQAEGYVFDFQKEIVEYCISDVEILTQACLKFRDLMKTETTVDPFQESTTIASCCNKVFRRNFLKPETIGVIPKGGYRWRENQSKIAIQWLLWEEHQRGIKIQHAAKGIETIVKGHKVDDSTESELYHPVLPSKMNNKLMFVNCQKCGEDFVRDECQHSIQERSLKGTWVIEEVLKAIEKGYQIIETYEIWEYDTIQLSKDQRKVEERAVYVDTDSCIYISRKGLDDISTGDFIGDMTDELNGGSYQSLFLEDLRTTPTNILLCLERNRSYVKIVVREQDLPPTLTTNAIYARASTSTSRTSPMCMRATKLRGRFCRRGNVTPIESVPVSTRAAPLRSVRAQWLRFPMGEFGGPPARCFAAEGSFKFRVRRAGDDEGAGGR
ncbi:unnamed protein product, partial [Acanthoscelides obtectus]